MRKNLILGSLLLLTGAGCASEHAERSAVGGGILGGITGLGVGILTGNPGAGLAIGAGTGAVAGAAVGNAQDRADRRAVHTAVANAYSNAMPLNQVVELAARGTPDDIIINQLNATGSFYRLTAADLAYLQDNRVSPNVIRAMQTRVPQPVAGPPPYGTVMIVEPAPPPVAVGVGIGYGGGYRRRGCW